MLRSMIPWTPRLPTRFGDFDRDFNEIAKRMFGRDEEWLPWKGTFSPSVNVAESDQALEVAVDLPGMTPEDVHVDVRENQLWISGERKEEKEEKGKTFHRVERTYGEFRRMVPLPTGVDAEKVEAKYDNGVLTVVVPKTEAAKPKRIEVKA